MIEYDLDKWFVSLTIRQKEHIACKVLLNNGGNLDEGRYPNCTDVWLGLDVSEKQKIHDHCTDEHNMWIQPGGNGTIYSY